MLGTLDILIAFVVIMTVLSLLITVLVQMVSAALSLRGKNLANALSLTFQSIDPQLGDEAYRLADHVLKDPLLSDSLFRPKERPAAAAPTLMRAVADQAANQEAAVRQQAITAAAAVQQAPGDLPRQLAATFAGRALQVAAGALQTAEHKADAALQAAVSGVVSGAAVLPGRDKPWGFIHWSGFKTLFRGGPVSARHLATAVRPGEVYRLLRDLAELSDDEATQRGFAGLNEKAADLLKALGVPDGPAQEAREKLAGIARIADLFTTDEQKQAVLNSLSTLGATVELASARSYDHFQRWFGSAQDRAEQWFQAHARNVTIVFAVLLAFSLQVDTVEVFHQLRASPGLVQALVKSAPEVLADGRPAPDADRQNATGLDAVKLQQENLDRLTHALDQTGFDIVPAPLLHRWQKEPWGDDKSSWWRQAAGWQGFLPHLVGMLITTALLALGAPFWFNILKNFMSLRPAVASLVEKRPRSAPALPQVPPTPGAPS